MPNLGVDPNVWEEAAAYLRKAIADGYRVGGLPSAYEEAARRLVADKRAATMKGAGTRVRHERVRALLADAPPAAPESPAVPDEKLEASQRREVKDASFWKRRASQLEKKLGNTEHMLDEVLGLDRGPIDPPTWMIERSSTQNSAAMGCLLSDLHCGEVVEPGEIHGVNAYDIDVFRERLRSYVSAVCIIGPRWMADDRIAGCFVALNGDLISGDIHDELRETNQLTSHEQVGVCSEELAAGIDHLRDTFGLVHVVCTPGNHGRTTRKPPAKGYGRGSYDTMIGRNLERHFSHTDDITFDIATGADIVAEVLGHKVFVTHGDKIGAGGGQGQIGPILPIARGGQRSKIQFSTINHNFDLMLTGHFHRTADLGNHLANGSMVGYSEFANSIRASIEPPQQWAFVLHERWLVRDRAPIKLDDTPRMTKPRVRIPAGRAMAA